MRNRRIEPLYRVRGGSVTIERAHRGRKCVTVHIARQRAVKTSVRARLSNDLCARCACTYVESRFIADRGSDTVLSREGVAIRRRGAIIAPSGDESRDNVVQ